MERSDKQKVEDYVRVLRCANKIFSTPEGQVVLEYIVSSTGVFSSSMDGSEAAMALRNFGTEILHIAGMQQGHVVPDVIKGIVNKASDTDLKDLRISVEEYLRSGGEIS